MTQHATDYRRAISYIELLLCSMNYYLLPVKHQNQPILVAGLKQTGCVILVGAADVPAPTYENPQLPADLEFLNLPVYYVGVRSGQDAKTRQHVLTLFVDPELTARFAERSEREFGIDIQAWPCATL